MSDSVRETITVHADLGTVFDVIADFAAYPEWQDEIQSVEVLETDDEGWGTKVHMVVDAQLFTTDLELDYTYTDTSMSWVLVRSDKLKRNDGTYDLTDLGDGSTEVAYSLVVEPAVPVPGMLRRRAAKRIVDGALKAMKTRAESLT